MAFLQNLNLNDNIAKNLALRENFFMMVVCVELRIPLFLVGKPGSSKSLSKTILDHNMQGRDSDTPLFKSLKQVGQIWFQTKAANVLDQITLYYGLNGFKRYEKARIHALFEV